MENTDPTPTLPIEEPGPEPAVEKPQVDQSAPPPPPQPENEPKPVESEHKKSKIKRLTSWYKSHKKISIPLTALVVFGIILAIPWSRYQAAGLVLKQNVTIKVVDSTTGTPVSGATVASGGLSAITDGNGQATLKLKDGWRAVSISKNYYDSTNSKVLAPILHQKSIPTISLQANGRQVSVAIKNRITGKLLPDVAIKLTGIEAKTDSSGYATLVLPVGVSSQPATLTASGYNESKVTIEVSDSEIKQNEFKMVPSGKIYFLSNRSGKLDVIGANLDGSSPKVILAGSGNEESYSTTMVVAPNGKHIALLTNRTSDENPQLYMINTSTEATSLIDQGNANFNVVGWLGDNLVYTYGSKTVKSWQIGQNRLKSYNASSGKTTLLSQGSATGNSTAAAYEVYGFATLTSDTIIYSKDWVEDYDLSAEPDLSSKQSTLNLIKPDGTGGVVVAKYPAVDTLTYTQYSPSYLYIQKYHAGKDSYYSYQIGGGAPIAVTIASSQFNKSYPYYYLSPDGRRAFWTETRDGNKILLVGDNNGGNAKTIASLEGYAPYGWYSNDYLLVSIGDNTLYIVGSTGGDPVKVTTYESANKPGLYYGGGSGRGGGGY